MQFLQHTGDLAASRIVVSSVLMSHSADQAQCLPAAMWDGGSEPA